jgi:hypothetical protein
MTAYVLPGNNPTIAAGYVGGDGDNLYQNLRKIVASIIKDEDTPYRYVLIYSSITTASGRRSWKLFEIKDPSAITSTTEAFAGVEVYVCRKVRGNISVQRPSIAILQEFGESVS